MGNAPDNHELDKRVAVLEEKMNTLQASLASTLNAFRADGERRRAGLESTLNAFRADGERRRAGIESTLNAFRADSERLRTDIERLRTDAARDRADAEKRLVANLRWQTGIWLATAAAIFGFMGFIARSVGAI